MSLFHWFLVFFSRSVEKIKWTYLGDYFELDGLPQHSFDVFFYGESISDRFSSIWTLCTSISTGQSQRGWEVAQRQPSLVWQPAQGRAEPLASFDFWIEFFEEEFPWRFFRFLFCLFPPFLLNCPVFLKTVFLYKSWGVLSILFSF